MTTTAIVLLLLAASLAMLILALACRAAMNALRRFVRNLWPH
jgi:hypothetical protein